MRSPLEFIQNLGIDLNPMQRVVVKALYRLPLEEGHGSRGFSVGSKSSLTPSLGVGVYNGGPSYDATKVRQVVLGHLLDGLRVSRRLVGYREWRQPKSC
jgi:hypothetical protein